MPNDLRELLRSTASSPQSDIDMEAIARRERQLRRSRLALRSVVCGLAIAAVFGIVNIATSDSGARRVASVPAPVSSVPPGWTVYRNNTNGFSVAFPRDWQRLPSPGNELLLVQDPDRITFCGASRATVTVVLTEGRTGRSTPETRYEPRPHAFGPRSGATTPAPPAGVPVDCNVPGLDGLTTQFVFFREKGRIFEAQVDSYAPDAAVRRVEAYKILDSLRFARASKLHRPPLTTLSTEPTHHPLPPQYVRVVVFNGGAATGSAEEMANRLRGLGYVIAAVPSNAPSQARTTVGCRPKFAKDGQTLARVVSPSAVLTKFPNPHLAGTELADCVVIIGQNT